MSSTHTTFPPSLSCFSSPFWCALCLATFSARFEHAFEPPTRKSCHAPHFRSFYHTTASLRACQLTLLRRQSTYFMPPFLSPVAHPVLPFVCMLFCLCMQCNYSTFLIFRCRAAVCALVLSAHLLSRFTYIFGCPFECCSGLQINNVEFTQSYNLLCSKASY